MLGWLIVGVVLVVGVPTVMYFAQDGLLFHPQRVIAPLPATPRRAIEALTFERDEGISLRGWLVKSAAPRAPLLVYYGGNAEEVSWQLHEPQWPMQWSLALINYRGYGASDGAPSERALYADALAVFDALVRRPDVDPSRIVLFGRSLGSGVATYVASERAVAGVILVSPYGSMTDLASHHYPWLPVSLLLKHPFDARSRAGHVRTPLLAIVGGRDWIIPPPHSRELYEAWAGPKQWRDIAAADHNDIALAADYWAAVGAFLRGLGRDDDRALPGHPVEPPMSGRPLEHNGR